MFHFKKPLRPVTKVYIHCSASDNPEHDNVATMEEWHRQRGFSGCGYHYFCRKSGEGEIGRSIEKTPAAQRGHNRGSIAICLHGLDEGKFTQDQLDWLIGVCWQINDAYDGNVTFHGHREVANKTCPVFDYQQILRLDAKGRLGLEPPASRAKMVAPRNLNGLEAAEAGGFAPMTLRFGDQNMWVSQLQEFLKSLGYHVGKIDGHFGTLTRQAVMAFQADNFLVEDGVAGRATFEAMEDAKKRVISDAREATTVMELAKGGSRIAQASVTQTAIGGTAVVGGLGKIVEDSTGAMTKIGEQFGAVEGMLRDLGPLVGILVLAGGALIAYQAIKAGRARRDDHRSGKTL